jgi:hypothetical protein
MKAKWAKPAGLERKIIAAEGRIVRYERLARETRVELEQLRASLVEAIRKEREELAQRIALGEAREHELGSSNGSPVVGNRLRTLSTPSEIG